MNGRLVVKRYAKALYEVSRDASSLEALMEDLAVLDRLMDELPEVRSFCLSGTPSPEKGRIVIETAFVPYLGEMTGRTVRLLEQNRRLAALPYLSEALKEAMDRDNGITRVLVESVSIPDGEMKKDIIEILSKRIPGRIEAVWNIRAGLLGGMTFQWDNRILDLSIKNRLGELKRELNSKSL